MERPALNKALNSAAFRDFYYLKEELVRFCRENGLSTAGGKLDLTERIARYLDTGEAAPGPSSRKKAPDTGRIEENARIEENFVCSQKHRAFFKEHIGKGFSFNVAFQNWLKSNPGKTYKDAIKAYYELAETKKNSKTEIGRQFEYNTYIRDFFSDNNKKPLEDAIKCWKYKKSLQGHNRYERADLAALRDK